MKKKKTIGATIISILLIIVGSLNLLYGASKESRFYIVDDFVVRLIGILLIIASIGIFRKSELARKSIIAICIASLVEIFITYKFEINSALQNISLIFVSIIVFVLPIVYFTQSK